MSTATTAGFEFSGIDPSRTAMGALVDDRVVALTDPGSAAGEQYRVLRHRIERVAREERRQAFAVTSSTSGEGKTTTAVNLALTLGAAGHRVALLDMDLRKGRVHSLLGFAPKQGLADVLLQRAEPSDVMWRFAQTGVYVMPAGRPPIDPAALLASRQAAELIQELKTRFTYVILDLPSLLPIADAQVAGDLADGIVLVVKAGQTTREVVEMALDAIPAEKLVGCVLNDVTPSESAELAPAFAAHRHQALPRPALPATPTPTRGALPPKS